MPTPTYVAIAKTVLTGSQLNITFSGIPSTYTDLVIVASARSDRALVTDNYLIELNGSATAVYSRTSLINNGSTPQSSNATGQAFWVALYSDAASATSNTFGSIEIYIPNYAGSTNKIASTTSVQEDNVSTGYASANAHLWGNTSAITSIKISPSASQNWISGSRFDLYGIKNS